MMKNFVKDKSNSRDSQPEKHRFVETSPFKADELTKSGIPLIVPVRLNQIKSVLKSKSSIESIKPANPVEFSKVKPSYVNHRLGGEAGRGLSPIRMPEHNSPRIFFDDLQQIA